MWNYEKRLQFPINITTPNAEIAKIIITQYGGPDGELGASMRYLSQRYTIPYKEIAGLLTDIGTEELAHFEMIGAIVYQLTKDLSMETRTDCAVAFCQTLRNAGYEPCVYFNRNLGYYGYDLRRLTDYLFWFSLPEMGYPSFYYAVDFWQYSFTETIAGVEGTADMNMMFIPVAAEESD